MRGMLLSVLAALCLSGMAQAQGPSPLALLKPAPEWAALSKEQQQALQPLRDQWSLLEPDQRERWLRVAERYPRLDEAGQQRMQRRMGDWARLSPAERQQARQGFHEARRLPASERQARWERYRSLSDDERRALQERANARRRGGDASQETAPQLLPRPPLKPPLGASERRPLSQRDVDPVTLMPRRGNPKAP